MSIEIIGDWWGLRGFERGVGCWGSEAGKKVLAAWRCETGRCAGRWEKDEKKLAENLEKSGKR